MIEIIAVLVLIGIMGAVVVNNADDFITTNDLVAEIEILKSNIRYAQTKSMNSSDTEVWQIYIDNAKKSYTLQQYNGATFEDRSLPGENEDYDGDGLYETHKLPDGITLKGKAKAAIVFNNWGIPVEEGNHGTAHTADLDVELKKGSQSMSLTVTRNTGFTYIP